MSEHLLTFFRLELLADLAPEYAGHLSDKDMKELYVMVSTSYQVRNKFDALLDQILLNRNEIISLIKQRDQLLPLLMTGQVSVG